MSQADLTVCIPTYNRAGFLRECLASLLEQGLGADDFVVAISDNASSDDTAEVVRSFESRLQIDYRCNAATTPAVDNLNAATTRAQTRFLAILCDDDLVAPGQLGRALACLRERPAASLFASLGIAQGHWGDPRAHVLGGLIGTEEVAPFLHRFPLDAWLACCSIHTPMTIIGSVFAREKITRSPIFSAEFPQESDRLLFASMAGSGEIYASAWIGGHLRYHPGQQTLRNEARAAEPTRVSAEVLARAEELGVDLVGFWARYLPGASDDELRWIGKLIEDRYPAELGSRVFASVGLEARWKAVRRKRRRRSLWSRVAG